MTTDVLAELRTLPGVDVDFGLKIVRQPSNYIQFLRKLVVERRHIALHFLALLDADRRDEAQRLAHTLKGTSGFFGLIGIQTQADALEIAIRNSAQEDDIIGMVIGLADSIDSLTAAIGADRHS
jgi:two-component system, sensor histidine kinase and response regulator